jgi:ribosomal protein L29
MSDDNTSSWTLNLDANDAKQAITALSKGLNQIGATDFSELAQKLTEIGEVAGAVGAAVLAIGESFKLVMDAEEIESVNQQFEVLAKNAGVFAKNLKEGLEASAGGLVDEVSLLKSASGAMVELGTQSSKLPQIMDLARKATAVFGGDLITNFQGISQAIATGNTRMLKHLGIVVDQQKAYEDYAKSIGVATDELSEAGKQHALMNAVLEKGQTSFAGVNTSLKVTQNAWTEFKATMHDVADSIALAWNKIAGPTVQSLMKNLASSAHYLSNELKAALGTGSEAAAASVENLTVKLTNLKIRQADLQKDANTNHLYDPALLASTNKQIADVTAQLEKQQTVVKTLAAEDQKAAAAQKTNNAQVVQVSEVNLQKRDADQKKFYADLEALRSRNDQSEIKSATSIEQVDKAAADRKIAIQKQAELQMEQLNKRQDLNEKQKADMSLQIQRQSNNQIKQSDKDLESERMQALTNLENQNGTIAEKVGNAWTAESKKAALEMQDFTKIATGSFNIVGQNAQSAFEQMGEGSETAGEAMKAFMFGSLGAIAEQAGGVMLLEGLWPPNPVAIAGGAALIALGGYLKGQGKGGSSSTAPSASVGSGSSDASSSTASTSTDNSASSGPSANQTAQQSVSFVVQGNLYSSNEAKLEMMDIMRSATDATDFRYTSVGGSQT